MVDLSPPQTRVNRGQWLHQRIIRKIKGLLVHILPAASIVHWVFQIQQMV